MLRALNCQPGGLPLPPMKRLSRYFLRGLLAVLPIGITVYLLFVFLAWTEGIAAAIFQPLLGRLYIPGLGLVLGVAAIGALGFFISQPAARKAVDLVELPFTNLPVVKSIYNSIKSFADYFSPQHKQSPQQVVVLAVPGSDLEMVGMVTRNSLADLPDGISKDDRVAVYLPMGYMIGGYTVFVPRSWIRPIQMSVEEAMRSSLIAWMAASSNTTPPSAEPPASWRS
jgi:uncharacterized membrane protein